MAKKSYKNIIMNNTRRRIYIYIWNISLTIQILFNHTHNIFRIRKYINCMKKTSKMEIIRLYSCICLIFIIYTYMMIKHDENISDHLLIYNIHDCYRFLNFQQVPLFLFLTHNW